MKKELEKIREKLEKEKEQLEQDLSRFAKKKPGSEVDWEARFPEIGIELSEDRLEDAAKAREEYEVRRFVEQALELKLKNVKDALEKLEENKYGVCEKCGKKIERERLEAVPEAKYCQQCKD
jgi:RNA polymerase-binding transcription factor DksA